MTSDTQLRDANSHPMLGNPTRACVLCGNLTHGSIGAAGLRWKFICQPCKNSEDFALEQSTQNLANALAKL